MFLCERSRITVYEIFHLLNLELSDFKMIIFDLRTSEKVSVIVRTKVSSHEFILIHDLSMEHTWRFHAENEHKRAVSMVL